MCNQKDAVEATIERCLNIIRLYEWLLDLYVLDYFVDNHFNKLPQTWRNCFQNMDPTDLGKIILGMPTKHMLPLSFLCLLKNVKSLSLPREMQIKNNLNVEKLNTNSKAEVYTCANHPRLKNLFLKHVKLKKRHEINLMAEVVNEVAIESSCNSVLDFGSGLGHLMRVLSYKYDIYSAGIECQEQLTSEARKLDQELEYTARKHLTEEAMMELRQPVHFNLTLSSEEQLHHLPLPGIMSNYGLVGLHPCGDLGPLLLRHFVNSPQVEFICVVGCCHMKLTCDGTGYPMSNFASRLNNKLSFIMREISCHAIEVYLERLIKGNYGDLKIHAYRASLERILIESNPQLKHAPVRSIIHSDTMNFEKYCTLALERLHIPVPTSAAVLARAEADLANWRRVVVVYTLRLALAPLVETVVLLDRVLYVLERGFSCEIRPVFDPKLSPRNHIIIGRKRKKISE